jgi:hypothetical protein
VHKYLEDMKSFNTKAMEQILSSLSWIVYTKYDKKNCFLTSKTIVVQKEFGYTCFPLKLTFLTTEIRCELSLGLHAYPLYLIFCIEALIPH